MLAALARQPLDRPPVWMMRQAGRYLPEYRLIRSRHSFQEAMQSPEIAAEISLQPLRRFPLDAAIVFSDIMTPLGAMGVDVDYDPGPKLEPLTLDRVADLDPLVPERVGFVAETVARVRAAIDRDVAVIGFAGGPITLLAYLLEGGGSQNFPGFRGAINRLDPDRALGLLADSMRTHLESQIAAGADVVQLFDTWAGLLSRAQFERWAAPAARRVLAGLDVPTIYFVPGGAHLIDLLPAVGAAAFGVDWRIPLGEAWDRLGSERVIQGNLDPAILLSNPATVREETLDILEGAAGRPGHIFNLGHGVLPGTPLENVTALVDTVVTYDLAMSHQPRGEKAASG